MIINEYETASEYEELDSNVIKGKKKTEKIECEVKKRRRYLKIVLWSHKLTIPNPTFEKKLTGDEKWTHGTKIIIIIHKSQRL